MDQLKELMEPLISGIHEFYGSTEGTYETINITKKLGQKMFDFLVNSFTTFLYVLYIQLQSNDNVFDVLSLRNVHTIYNLNYKLFIAILNHNPCVAFLSHISFQIICNVFELKNRS